MGEDDKNTDGEGENSVIMWEDDNSSNLNPDTDHDIKVSIHALMGSKSTKSLKIQGKLQGRDLSILFDSGSTHNFLSLGLAKKLQLRLKPCSLIQVTVANGENLLCSSLVENLEWSMAGECFETDVHVLPLGGYDLILGVEWMTSVSPVTFDFEEEKVTIRKGDKNVTLTQSTLLPQVKLKLKSPTVKTTHEEALFLVQVTAMEEVNSPELLMIPIPDVATLVKSFSDVFALPTQLPPPRKQDHHIPLKPNSSPIEVSYCLQG